MSLHRSGPAFTGVPQRIGDQVPAQQDPVQHGDQDDHDRSADELGSGELPAHQQCQQDAQLDDQVRGGDLEDHRGGEAGALAEQRPGQRDGGVGAGRGGDAEAGRDGQSTG
jgi:hypothetical protein